MNRPALNPVINQLLQVVGPALIGLMVGSIVWFLIEIFYRGPHNGRLCWIFGLFSAAAVLVSRISIESGRERSWIFAVPLAGATIFVAATLIQGGFLWLPMLVAFVLFVLWAADRLTWDCTVIDRSRDASAVGLMELAKRKLGWGKAGAEEKRDREQEQEHEHEHEHEKDSQGEESKYTASDARAGNLFLSLLGLRRGRNTPGLWTMGFAGAALLVFGFGQLFVIRDAEWGYGWVALLFGVFLGSTIALLTLTSLLGLERYLLGRQLELPPGLARRWMTVGLTLAALVAMITFLVPKPNLSGRLESAAAWLTSRSRDPSSMAFGKDGVNQGADARSTTNEKTEGQPAGSNPPDNAPHRAGKPDESGAGQPAGSQPPGGNQPGGNQSGGSQPGGNKPGGRQPGGSQPGGSQPGGNQPGGQQSGSSQSNNQQQDSSPSSDGQAGSNSDPGGQKPASGNREQGQNSPAADTSEGQPPQSGAGDNAGPQGGKGNSDQKAADDKTDPGDKQTENENPLNKQDDDGSGQKDREPRRENGSNAAGSPHPEPPKNRGNAAGGRPEQAAPEAQPSPASQGSGWLSSAAGFMARWIAILCGLLALAVAGWLFREEIRRFLVDLRAWWESLFAPKEQAATGSRARAATSAILAQRSFLSLSNPFRDGRHQQLPAADLARESFEALETLAGELGAGRPEDSTPHEFAEAVAGNHSRLATAARQLAAVYNAVAYGSGRLTASQLGQLREAWQQMEQFAASGVQRQPQPAG